MRTTPTAYAADTEPIVPECLYPLAALHKASGISRERMRQGRLQGIEPESIRVGRRVFVEGSAAISYIKRLAAAGLCLLLALLILPSDFPVVSQRRVPPMLTNENGDALPKPWGVIELTPEIDRLLRQQARQRQADERRARKLGLASVATVPEVRHHKSLPGQRDLF